MFATWDSSCEIKTSIVTKLWCGVVLIWARRWKSKMLISAKKFKPKFSTCLSGSSLNPSNSLCSTITLAQLRWNLLLHNKGNKKVCNCSMSHVTSTVVGYKNLLLLRRLFQTSLQAQLSLTYRSWMWLIVKNDSQKRGHVFSSLITVTTTFVRTYHRLFDLHKSS